MEGREIMSSPPTKSNAIDENRKRHSPPTNSNAIDGDLKRIKPSTDAMEGDNQKQDSDEIINADTPPTNSNAIDADNQKRSKPSMDDKEVMKGSRRRDVDEIFNSLPIEVKDSNGNLEWSMDADRRLKFGEVLFERAKDCKGDWRWLFTEDGYLRKERLVSESSPPPTPKSDHDEAVRMQRLALATKGLDYYNKINKEDIQYELVETLAALPVVRKEGILLHGNFLAKPKNTSTDTSPKFFFAETWNFGFPGKEVAGICRIMQPDPRDSDQAPNPNKIYHPEDVICNWCDRAYERLVKQ